MVPASACEDQDSGDLKGPRGGGAQIFVKILEKRDFFLVFVWFVFW